MELPRGIERMLRTLREEGHAAYLAGGCVRDACMGKKPHDFDIATAALPEEILRIFGERRCKAYGRAFGTVGVLHGGSFAEITTFRTEGDYADSRHPGRVDFTTNVMEDLSRRDFTCNAMAFCPEEGLLDPFGGRNDLESGILRCVGTPQLRFREDALRILRGLRFLSRFGWRAEPLTDAAMRAGAHRLRMISEERVFSELCEILMGEHAAQVLLAYPDVLGVCIPEILPCVAFSQHNKHHDFTVWGHMARAVGAAPKVLEVRLAMLFHDIAKPQCFTIDAQGGHFKGHEPESARMADAILQRLRCPSKLRRTVCRLIAMHREIPGTMAKTRRLRGTLSDSELMMLYDVFRADDASKREGAYDDARMRKVQALLDRCIAEGLCCRISELAVNGEDLTALGIGGKQVGAVLRALLEAVIAGKCRNEKNYLLEYYRRNFRKTHNTGAL